MKSTDTPAATTRPAANEPSSAALAYTSAQAILDEFERELITTRTFIERIPAERLTWRPHEKSMTAGQLALHIAQTLEGVVRFAIADEETAPDFSGERPQPANGREVLDTLDRSAAYVRQTLPSWDDARMRAAFTIVRDGRTLMSMPRALFLRNILLNHVYHHRGQLGVYLRLVGAKVPPSYGPSGDESPFA
jgi:uncharacterized damage-inducible protein DinB